jgi:lincosamide nucleotidyltransferase A/C/D/E
LTAPDVCEVLDALDRASVEVWLDGGWGIDALLGRETRAHDDLDLVVARDNVPAVRAALPAFAHDQAASPGLPARYVVRDGRRRQVDFHLVDFDERGGWQRLPDGSRALYPRDDLRATGVVGGRAVRCISAELQVRHHSGYERTEKDERDVAALVAEFGVRRS